MTKRSLHLVGRVESRNMTPATPEIKDVTCSNALGRLDASQHGHVVRGARQYLSDQAVFAAGAVLEVNEQPIKTAQRTRFGGEGEPRFKKVPRVFSPERTRSNKVAIVVVSRSR